MRKIISFLFVLFLGVICSACVNSFAVKELNENALKYMQEGNIQASISRLESSVDLDSNIYESRYNLAIAYLKVDECQKAIDQLKEAIKLPKADKSSVYYTMGVAYNCQSDKVLKKDDKATDEKDLDDEEDIIDKDNLPDDIKQEYLSNLENAMNSFDEYLKITPNANDKEDVEGLIGQISAEIDKLNSTKN